MNVGSLFAGIGGFDLGFERAGMRTVWQVEQDEYCRRVLAKHFPGAERHVDVCDVGAHNLSPVDLICGGFPCQDISLAGKGAGLAGERSGLWSEYARIVRELRPRYVVVENVSALLDRGFGSVVGDLAACWYDAEWDCIPAAAVGAPHGRDRVWLVAYRDVSYAASVDGFSRRGVGEGRERGPQASTRGLPSDALAALGAPEGPWAAGEPNVDRMAHGLPCQVDRLRVLGNALVPQIAEWIGRRLMELESC